MSVGIYERRNRTPQSKKEEAKNERGLGNYKCTAEIKNSVEGLGDKVAEINYSIENKR